MTQAQSKSYSGVKKKLMGAVSMLLVASIMMVSATYAWFTLSTAPEITGITTSVGANGNLEIALLNNGTYANLDSITSAVGNSSAATDGSVTKANVTWGNLVDLSDDSYGLNLISLNPAALNVDATSGNLNTGAMLSTAMYGADGRVEKLDANTTTAIYNGNGAFETGEATEYGVRVVGTSDAISARELALRTAKGSFTSAQNSASSYAKAGLDALDVTVLGLMATAQGTDVANASVVTTFKNVAANEVSALASVETAYRQYLIAKVAANDGVTDVEFETYSGQLKTAALSAIADKWADRAVELRALVTSQSNAATVVSNLNALAPTATYNELKTAVAKLVDVDALKDQVSGLSNINVVIQNAAGSTSVMGDVADYVGAYSKTLGSLGSITVKPANDGNVKLAAMATEMSSLTAPGGIGGANAKVTSYYGYVMDMAFRTNASGSNLQLQTAGIDRVYSENDNAGMDTQGGGSTLKLAYGADLTETQAKTLLDAIRVVFFNPADGTIYGTAATGTATAASNVATADLYMVESLNKVTHTAYKLGKNAYTWDSAGNTYRLIDYANFPVNVENTTYEGWAVTITEADYNALYEQTSKYEYVTVDKTLSADKSAITALAQNTAQRISVLVYMDGELVDNADVANSASSGTLTMNLQFSSSADLVPMNSSSLKGMESTAITGGMDMTSFSGTTTHGNSVTTSVTLTNTAETVKTILWTTSNPSVATVTESETTGSATVNYVGNGTATIAALVTTDKGNVYVSSQSVTVTTPATGAHVTDANGNEYDSKIVLTPGKSINLTAYLSPNGTTETIKGVKWNTDSVGSFDVTVNDSGTVIVTAPNTDGATGTLTATIATQTKEVDDTSEGATEGAKKTEVDFENGTESVTLTLSCPTKMTDSEVTLSDAAAIQFTKETAGSKNIVVSESSTADNISGVYAASNLAGVNVSVDDKTVTVSTTTDTAVGDGKVVIMVVTKNGATIIKTVDVSVVVATTGESD